MANVKFIHPDLKLKLPEYELISDVIQGQERVKYRKQKYLPMPLAHDQSPQNVGRYLNYLARAVFYNVTRRTLNGLVGAVFETPPVSTLPTTLDPVVADASGAGVPLDQLAQDLVRTTMAKGRSGLFTDFPDAPAEGISREQAQKLQPNITCYQPEDIINWRIAEIDGKDQLTLVVLREDYIVSDDGFEQKKQSQWRVLRLTSKVYSAEIWRDTNLNAPIFTFNPTDAKGAPLDHIPFHFVGSQNNDAKMDDPPLYDMASLNIAHYRNSADYEEAVFIVGQPTPYFTGLTASWVKQVWSENKVELGSRAAIPLPEKATAGMLQAQENGMSFEAMEHKEQQMIALGARLVEQSATTRTATEAKMDDASETSILANVSRNSQTGIELALRDCLVFLEGGDQSETKLEYKLNTEFGLSNLPPDELASVLLAWQDGSISWTEMRARLKRGGLATQDDTAAKTEIDGDQAKKDAADVAKGNQIAEGAAAAAQKFPAPTTKPGPVKK